MMIFGRRGICLIVLACLSVTSHVRADAAPPVWRQALGRLQAWPPDPHWTATSLSFALPQGGSCRVAADIKPRSSAPPVIYISDGGEPGAAGQRWPGPVLRLDARTLAADGSFTPDPMAHPLVRTTLAAQRALALLVSRRDLASDRVGLIGEGLGGSAALALAALQPEHVGFVCVHAPVAVRHYLPDGRPTTAEGLQSHLLAAEEQFAGMTLGLRQALANLDLIHLAPAVRCPTLVSLNLGDVVAPPDEIRELYEELRCEKELVEFRVAGHCQRQDLTQWARVWRQWAGEMAGFSPTLASKATSS